MDFPKFSGVDAKIWIDQCNTYFSLYTIPEGFKVSAATMNFIEPASHWYHSFKMNHAYLTWEQLQAAVVAEFEVNNHRDKLRELRQLTQEGSVADYKCKFDQLVYHIKLYDARVGELMLVTQFIAGLKDELKGAVECYMPESVTAAATIALVQEGVLSRARRQIETQLTAQQNHVPSHRKEARTNGHGPEVWKAQQLKEYRHTHGLCYRCGEKYAPGHQCTPPAQAQLKAMDLAPDSAFLSDDMLNAVMDAELNNSDDEAALLSIHSMVGTVGEESLQLRALVGKQVMLFLVDSGSSHSFINANMVDRLSLTPVPCPRMRVKVASGDMLTCSSEVKPLTWWVKGHTFETNMKVLELGGYDGVLGMDWLKAHNPMTCDWVGKALVFEHKGETIHLQGIPPQVNPQPFQTITPEQLMRWHKGNDIWAMAVLDPQTRTLSPTPPVPVQELLDKYQHIFQQPTVLPPHRAFDHAITLLPHAPPVLSTISVFSTPER